MTKRTLLILQGADSDTDRGAQFRLASRHSRIGTCPWPVLGTPPNVSLLVPHHGALPTLWLLWLYLFLSLGVTKSHQALQLRSPLFVVDVKCEKTGRRNHHVHGTSPDVCFSLG